MKKQPFILMGIVIAFCVVANAQNRIVVDHNGTPAVFTTLASAITAAVNGDYIYLTGGVFAESATISKKLHLFGAGHYNDSTAATGITYITGNITVATNADSSSFEGIYLGGAFTINTAVNHIALKYSSVGSLTLGTASDHAYINGCVIRGNASGSNMPYNFFEKNIFDGNLSNFNYAMIRNNIFMGSSITSGYCVYENNIFISANTPAGTNIINNNLFTGNYTITEGVNNIVNQSQASIFINQTGSTFNYAHNYHLKPTCPGVGAGTDGTDIGIYGTGKPYKEGAVPSNPHIRFDHTVKENNFMKTNIKVSAQDR